MRDSHSVQLTHRAAIALGFFLLLAATIAVPHAVQAGDADSVAGYKYRIYEETPPGDGPTSSSSLGYDTGTQGRMSNPSIQVTTAQEANSRLVLDFFAELWKRLRIMALVR